MVNTGTRKTRKCLDTQSGFQLLRMTEIQAFRKQALFSVLVVDDTYTTYLATNPREGFCLMSERCKVGDDYFVSSLRQPRICGSPDVVLCG